MSRSEETSNETQSQFFEDLAEEKNSQRVWEYVREHGFEWIYQVNVIETKPTELLVDLLHNVYLLVH